jgi:hypothetical protein
LRGFITCAQPVTVPPVPVPQTRMSTLPSVSRQISSAVVLRWISGFAGFSELLEDQVARVLRGHLLGALDRALHPLGARREHELRAERDEQLAALDAHRLRHREDEPVALRRGSEREPDPGVAARRLEQDRVRLDLPLALGGLNHGDADAVLHAPSRVPHLELGRDRRLGTVEHAVEPDERRVADELRDVFGDAHVASWDESGLV